VCTHRLRDKHLNLIAPSLRVYLFFKSKMHALLLHCFQSFFYLLDRIAPLISQFKKIVDFACCRMNGMGRENASIEA